MTRSEDPMKTSSSMCVLAVACVMGALQGCATTGGNDTIDTKPGGGDEAGGAVGRPLPALAVKTLNGDGTVSLSQLRGKVVLLDIWASWCGPCKEELPLLDEMAGRLKAKNVELIAVSIDEDRSAALAFLRARPRWSLTLAHDPKGKLPELLQPPKMPTSYIVDRQGVVRQVNAGFERGDISRLESRLAALAAE